MKQTRTIAEYWSPLFAQTRVTYLTFVLLILQTFTKLKTTFGRNLFFCSTLSEFENFLLCERILINVTTCQNETSS
jgi:hypothetical protein